MHMILRRSSGRRFEAVLLAVSPNRLRAAARGYQDVLELTLAGGQWISHRGEAIEVESLAADDRTALAAFYSGCAPRTMTAGGSAMYQ